MREISRGRYSDLYGPTTGYKVRLGDTSLFAEVEKELTETLYEKEREPERLIILNQLVSALVESTKEAIDIAEISANRALESSGDKFSVERGSEDNRS